MKNSGVHPWKLNLKYGRLIVRLNLTGLTKLSSHYLKQKQYKDPLQD